MAAKRGCVCRRMYYCLILELCPMMAEPEQKKKRILWCCFSSSIIICVYGAVCVCEMVCRLGWSEFGLVGCWWSILYLHWYYRLPRNWEMDISLGKTGRHQPMQSNRNDVLLVAMMLLQSAHHLLCPSSTFLALLTPAELKPFSADSSPRTVLSRAPPQPVFPAVSPPPSRRAGRTDADIMLPH